MMSCTQHKIRETGYKIREAGLIGLLLNDPILELEERDIKELTAIGAGIGACFGSLHSNRSTKELLETKIKESKKQLEDLKKQRKEQYSLKMAGMPGYIKKKQALILKYEELVLELKKIIDNEKEKNFYLQRQVEKLQHEVTLIKMDEKTPVKSSYPPH